MMYGKKINTKRDRMHPILIWIIASILLHLLIMLGLKSIKMHQAKEKNKFLKNISDRAILMLDEPKNKSMQQTALPAPQTSIDKKKQEPKPKHKLTDFTLIPGRAGIDKQQLDDPANLKNLPTPENQHLKKQLENKMPKTDPLKKEFQEPEDLDKTEIEESPEPTIAQKAIEKIENIPTALPSSVSIIDQKNENKIQEKSTINSKKSKKIRIIPNEQNPYEYTPNPSREISFKNLNLGFDINAPTIGNNAHMIQQGITFAAPDEVSLKHLTYYHQCAGMMKTAFATHPQVRLRPYATGKRFRFDITVDRKGNQINFVTIQGSGDMILDKIIQESIQSVTMFPNVPNFIEDNPFVMKWTFLH